MTGRRYYITTLGAWKRHSEHFANSHWLLLGVSDTVPTDVASVLAIVDADEGVHLNLESDAAFEALPSPLGQRPISEAAHSALAAHGVQPGATMFEAAEAAGQVHPLLRHRVF